MCYEARVSLVAALTLGFSRGVAHALEADHLAAVATLAADDTPGRGALAGLARAARSGALWGLGHGVAVLLVGGALVLAGATVPDGLARLFELSVGLTLVVLGALSLARARATRPPAPTTSEAASASTASPSPAPLSTSGAATSGAATSGAARGASTRSRVLVGLVHGVSGSAALSVFLALNMRSRVESMLFLALFGVATVAAMAAVSSVVGWSLRGALVRAPRFALGMRVVAAAATLVAGVAVMASTV